MTSVFLVFLVLGTVILVFFVFIVFIFVILGAAVWVKIVLFFVIVGVVVEGLVTKAKIVLFLNFWISGLTQIWCFVVIALPMILIFNILVQIWGLRRASGGWIRCWVWGSFQMPAGVRLGRTEGLRPDSTKVKVGEGTHLKVTRVIRGVCTAGVSTAKHGRSGTVDPLLSAWGRYPNAIAMPPLMRVHVCDVLATGFTETICVR